MKIRKKEPLLLQTNRVRRCIAWVSACALILSMFTCMGPVGRETAQAAVTLHNPIYDSGVREVAPGTESAIGKIHNPVYNAETDETTWDCVWFGNYWQSDTNGDGVADKNDEKEPVKWRVLSVDGDDVFLLADRNLDEKLYNETLTDVTWETCTLRSWLNGYDSIKNDCGIDYTADNFIDNAFSNAEQGAIKNTIILNEDNPDYDTEGGNNTTDKVYLLSIAEASNPVYGFDSEFEEYSDTRMALKTAYLAEGSGYSNSVGEADWWWLRSPGGDSSWAASVDVYGMGNGGTVNNNDAIRPALHLTLSSLPLLSYGGTVPSHVGGIATWDCVYFGNYWQSDTNGDGVADKNDEKESIKWRVLSVDGDDVCLLADKNLDVKPYNEAYTDVTWESCTLRSWLNGYDSTKNDCGTDYTANNFIDNAFSAAEQGAIKTTNVLNEDNPYYDTEGGNNTTDKVYLLSIAEASNPAYGFCHTYRLGSDTRVSLNTAYAKEQDAYTYTSRGSGWWWLRSPGHIANWCYAAGVDYDGCGDAYGNLSGAGEYDSYDYAVRPALHLTLSSSTPLTYAGTVCSDGTVTDADGNIQTPTPVPTASPTAKPTAISTAKPTSIPTAAPIPDITARPVSPTKSPVGNENDSTTVVGQMVKDTSTNAFYQLVSTGSAGGTVSYVRSETKTKKAKVPAVIYHSGRKYKVTSVAAKAFAGNKKLKTVVIGKNVKKIQKKAFANCKKLSKMTVKSKVLNKVAKSAFKGTNKKLTVKVPKKEKAKYKKLFRGKGNKKLKVK